MASEGGGGADLVGFLIGLILFGALAQTAMMQISKLTTPQEPTANATTEQQPALQPPTATSTRI